jgi:uncharacterized membrane protein YdjX (TVP38/TMEM64 family)
MKLSVRLRIALAAGLLALIVAGVALLPVQQYLKSFLEWIGRLGPWAPVFLVAFDAAVCLLCLPGSAVTLVAGFLWGTAGGSVVASLGATLGAAAAFLISRLLLRGWIERRLAGHPAVSAVDRAIGSEGFRIVLLVRLCSLLPYDLMSYALGLTKVSLRRYLLGTWLGRLPEIVLWAYIGSTAKSLADVSAGKVQAGIGGRILLGLGITAMIAATLVLSQIARKALRDVLDPKGAGPSSVQDQSPKP